MKTIFKSTLLIFLGAALLTVTSCDKDDDATPEAPPTEKSKLTNKDFVISDYNVTLNGASYMTYSNLQS